MVKVTWFVVKFKSRRDATLFHNTAQQQMKEERSHNGFTEYEHAHHWKSGGGLMLTVNFKDPVDMEGVKELSFGCDKRFLNRCQLLQGNPEMAK